jgi:hypothetical protein
MPAGEGQAADRDVTTRAGTGQRPSVPPAVHCHAIGKAQFTCEDNPPATMIISTTITVRIPHSFRARVQLTDRVSAASVKAGAAGASRALARGAVDVTAKLVGCIR